MEKEFDIDINLFYLENILFDLDKYNFADDITKKLNELKNLVEQKMWGHDDLAGYDILDEKIKIQLFLKKNTKNA